MFHFDNDKKEIHQFIAENFIVGKSETSKIRIDKNNFMVIYSKWLTAVKPTISVNWEIAKVERLGQTLEEVFAREAGHSPGCATGFWCPICNKPKES